MKIRVFGRELTEEQKQLRKEQNNKNNKAEEFLTTLYGVKNARVIVANIIINYHNIHQKMVDFETAWNGLSYEIINEILYRALNDLPGRTKQQGVINYGQ